MMCAAPGCKTGIRRQTHKVFLAHGTVNPQPAEFHSVGEKKSPQHCVRNAAGMGGTRLELVTSTMSTWRSNQLS